MQGSTNCVRRDGRKWRQREEMEGKCWPTMAKNGALIKVRNEPNRT